MPRSPSPTDSLIGPSRSNSVVRQYEKKPYERPTTTGGSNAPPPAAQNGLLGGLKRSLSRWFSNPAPESQVERKETSEREDEAASRRQPQGQSERFKERYERAETPKRQAPKMSLERGTPSKKQRIVSPTRLEVQGRAVESFNVREYGSSRLPTRTSNGIPNYARPFGAAEVSGGGMSRSQSTGAYNDPPLSLLTSSASRQKAPLSGGMRRSETMTLNLDRSGSQRGHLASPLRSSNSMKSPLYSASGLSRSSTAAGNLSAGSGSLSMGRISSPLRGQQEAAERAARQRAIREGSFVPASPSRHGLRSSSRMDVDGYRTRDAASPAPRAESPRRSMSTVPFPRSGSARDVSMIPASPSREVSRTSRLRYSARPMSDEEHEEVLMGDADEEEAEAEEDMEVEEERFARRRGTSGARMSVDVDKRRAPSELMDQSIKAETLLEQLAEMRKASRHANVQAGRPSSVQAVPIPASLSTRQLRKRMAVKVPKASTPAEELKLISSLSEGPARLRGTRLAKEFEMDKNKAGSVMQRPYARKASGSGKLFEAESAVTSQKQEREDDSADESEDRMKTDEAEKPFTFSMANAPTKVTGPMNIQFSPSATKIVRTGPSTLRAQTTKTNRKHEPAATRKVDSRPNQFALPDEDDDEGMEDDDKEIELERQPSKSPQPVSIPPPVRSPSPRNKKDVDVTAVRKTRGFLDAAGINRPRASSPLAGTPLNATTLVKPVASREKPSLQLASPATAKPPAAVSDFFAMPKTTANASASTGSSTKGPTSIGLGRPGTGPAPSFAFTAPSPTSSPSVPTDRPKPSPAFSFDAPPSTTPIKPPPFVSSAPSAASGGEASTKPAAVPDFFAKPAAASSQPAEPTSTAAAPPSFFGNVAPPPVASTGSFSFGPAKPPPKLFGSSEGTMTSTSTPAATPAQAQSKSAEEPAVAPSASGFKFGTTSSTSVLATGGLFGSVKPATPSPNPLFGGISNESSTPSAASRPADTVVNSNPTPSTMFGAPAASTGFSFGGSSTSSNGPSTPAAAPAPAPAFSFSAPASKGTTEAAAPTLAPASTGSFKFGAGTNIPFAPANSTATVNAGGSTTPSAAPPAFSFGSTTSAPTPASSPFTFGSTNDNSAKASSPAPFVFGAAPATSSPFGNTQPATTGPSSAKPFGSSTPASTGMFGSNPTSNAPANVTPTFGGFGQTAAPAAPAPSPFGQPPASAPALAPASGFGGFGAPAQPAAPTGMFGATSTGFGSNNGSQPGMFGSAPGTPGTPGTANTGSGFNFSMGAAGPAFPAGPDGSRQASPAFSVGAGDASSGRKIRKMPTARKK